MQNYRGMKRFQEREAADLSHKDHASWCHCPHRAFQDVQEVVETREILRDAVNDDGIKRCCWDVHKIVGCTIEQLHLGQYLSSSRQSSELVSYRIQGYGRNIRAPILSGIGS